MVWEGDEGWLDNTIPHFLLNYICAHKIVQPVASFPGSPRAWTNQVTKSWVAPGNRARSVITHTVQKCDTHTHTHTHTHNKGLTGAFTSSGMVSQINGGQKEAVALHPYSESHSQSTHVPIGYYESRSFPISIPFHVGASESHFHFMLVPVSFPF